MPLQRLHLKNFRLFQDKIFNFSPGTNLILGTNGSGKTTILESLNILLTGSSFRAKETKECIGGDKEFYNILGKGTIRDQNLLLSVENSFNKRLKSSRKLQDSSIKKEELFFLQLVLAKNLKMIDGEPEIRREYFNELMFHVKPQTKTTFNRYQKAIKQRNRCLKNNLSKDELSIWSKEVSSLGLDLSIEQYNFFKIFKEYSKDFIGKIVSQGAFKFLEGADVTFSKGWERSKNLISLFPNALIGTLP